MKKPHLLLTIALHISLISFSQNPQILVEYDAIKSNLTNKETLIATPKKAFYTNDYLLIENDSKPKIVESDEPNIKIVNTQKKIELEALKYYLEKDENIIYYTQNFKNKKSLIKDSLPNYQWDITSTETKKIGDFLCKKATTNFRGSHIVAWYAEEINIPFGPWKFKGLPGLILELYNVNDTNTQHWVAKKITYPYKNKTQYNYSNNLPIVKFKTIVENREEQIRKQMRVLDSRAPKGVTTTSTKITRLGIEKKYEWEN